MRRLFLLMTVMVCVPLGAQTVHRDSVIALTDSYLQAEPGSKGYEQVASRINHLKAEAFMQ